MNQMPRASKKQLRVLVEAIQTAPLEARNVRQLIMQYNKEIKNSTQS